MKPDSYSKNLFSTSALCVATGLYLASPAVAKDTLVDDLLSKADTDKASVTIGSREESGTGIEWRDVVIASDDGKARLAIEWINLEETGNGDRVTIAPVMTLDVQDDDDSRRATFEIGNVGLAYLLNESGDNVSQEFSADAVTVTQVDGNMFDAFSMQLENISGGHIYPGDNLQAGTGNFVANNMSLGYSVIPDDDNGALSAQNSVANVTMTYSYDATGVDFAADQPDTSLVTGEFTMTGGASKGEMQIASEDMSFNLTSSGEGYDVNGSMREGQLAYGGSAQGIDYVIELPAMGLPPANVSLASANFEFAMPTAKTDADGDLRLKLGLNELSVDEALWGLFDPQAMLPRDPANIRIDLEGKARLLSDFADMQGGNVPPTGPIQVSTARINELVIQVAGAELLGSGAVDITYENVIPSPVGTLNFNLNGLNALMDSLMAMGLLQPEQAMPARMMLSMFARPVGDDQLESVIEFQQGGAILANGQRIR